MNAQQQLYAIKTAHSRGTLYGILKQTTNRQIDGILSISISRTDK